MLAPYDAWIKKYEEREGSVWMKCVEATVAMATAFPELRIVRGTAVSTVSGKRWCHCWLVDPLGYVVDPTAAQFSGHVRYEYTSIKK
jgi:hypothetical protein